MPLDQYLSSLAGSLNMLLWSLNWMFAALPHSRQCTNQWMFLHQSAYLDHNLYRAGFPGQLHQEWLVQHREEMNVSMHMWLPYWGFGNIELHNCYQFGRLACWAEEPTALESAVCIGQVEEHLFICITSMSADSVGCYFGKKDIRLCGFDETSHGVFQLHPLPIYAQEPQHTTSSLFGSRHEVSWSDIACALLQRAKTSLWPLWPYLRPGACWTVPAVADLLAFP